MPLISIPIAARDRACELAIAAKSEKTWDVAYRHGFFDALRTLLPSEVVGLIVMDADCAAEGEEMPTDAMPKLVLG